MEKIIKLFDEAVEVANECNSEIYNCLKTTENYITSGIDIWNDKFTSNIMLTSSLIGLIKYTEEFLTSVGYFDIIETIRKELYSLNAYSKHLIEICNNRDKMALEDNLLFVIKNKRALQYIISPSMRNDNIKYIKETLLATIFVISRMLAADCVLSKSDMKHALLNVPYTSTINKLLESVDITGFSKDDNMKYVVYNAHAIASLCDSKYESNNDEYKEEMRDLINTVMSYAKSAMRDNNISIYDISRTILPDIYSTIIRGKFISIDECYDIIKNKAYENITTYADMLLTSLDSHEPYEVMLPKLMRCLVTSMIVAIDCLNNRV